MLELAESYLSYLESLGLRGFEPEAFGIGSSRFYLVSSGLVVVLAEQLGDLLHVYGVVEGRGVSHLALVGAQLALEALDQMADGHSGGDGVRVDHNIGGQALAAERHVLLTVLDPAGTWGERERKKTRFNF